MRYSLLILSVLLITASCTKVEVPDSKQEILKASRWQARNMIVTSKVKADGTTTTENQVTTTTTSFDQMPECRKDDVFVFRDNNLGAHVTGELTCTINETSEIQFTWGIFEDDTKMYIYDAKEFFGQDVNADLLEFYDDKFTIRFYEYNDKRATFPDVPTYWVRDTTETIIEFQRL